MEGIVFLFVIMLRLHSPYRHIVHAIENQLLLLLLLQVLKPVLFKQLGILSVSRPLPCAFNLIQMT